MKTFKYSVTEHDVDTSYGDSLGVITLSCLPSKVEVIKEVGKLDRYAALVDPNKFKLEISLGSLPAVLKVIWIDSNRVMYTVKPV